MWEAVPEQEHEAVRRQVGEVVRELRRTLGPFSFTQQVRYTLGRRC